MPRLFIAIPCPDELKDPLVEIQNNLKNFGRLRPVERENIHLTLRFLGNVEEAMIEKIKRELDFLSDIDRFEVSLRGVGAFPSLNYIRVVWIGVKQGTETLKKIHKEIENKLTEMNFKPENRFHPHFTIARVKYLKEKGKMLKFLQENSNHEFGKFQADRIELMESKLSPRGPAYSVLHKFNFK